jgi:hypothetical protein
VRHEAAQALADLDRRSFLRLAAALAAGLAPAGCGGVPEAYRPPPGLVLRYLTPRGYAVLRAAAERVVGGPGGELLRAGSVDPAPAVEAFLARSPELAGPLGQALWVLEFGLPPLIQKLRPFSALPGPERDRVLSELMSSRFALKRALFRGVRSVALLGFYGSAACQPVSRFPGVGGSGPADALRPLDP